MGEPQTDVAPLAALETAQGTRHDKRAASAHEASRRRALIPAPISINVTARPAVA